MMNTMANNIKPITNNPMIHDLGGGLYETSDYDLFTLVKGNRQIHQGHVKNLMVSIMKKNLLRQNPISVNEKFEVIDGQHRLNAARGLGIPVPFKVMDGATLAEVQLLNAHNKQWVLNDYLNSFIIRGNRDYVELKEFVETYHISISIALQLLSGSTARPQEAIRVFKEGNFKIKDREEAEKFADKLFELEEYSMPGVWRDREFMNALITFNRTNSHAELMSKLRAGKGMIMRALTTGDYLRQLDRIMAS